MWDWGCDESELQTGLLEMKGFHGIALLWRKDTAWDKSVSQAMKVSTSLSPHTPALLYKEVVAVISQNAEADPSPSTPPFKSMITVIEL